MRKLASIQRVLATRPIEGADRIEAVDVLGWTCVAQKGEFKVGDLCIYLEIDSFINGDDPRFATFSERFTNWGGMRGMRVKTIRLKKQISQGLLLKVENFPEVGRVSEGDDVTEKIGILKWEPAEESHGNAGGVGKVAGAGKFPSFLRKTDQERVQNYIGELPKYADHTFEVSIKLDGSSMTVFNVKKDSVHYAHCIEDMEARALRRMSFFGKLWYKAKKTVGLVKLPDSISGLTSRNIELPIDDDNHFSKYVREHGLIDKLATLDRSYAIQGELIAPTIQGNYEKVEDFEFHVYDIFDIDNQTYLEPFLAREIAGQCSLKYVPVLHEVANLKDFGYSDGCDMRAVVDNILAFAEGPGMNKGVKREGCVFKSNDNEFSFKAISNSYLLAKEKKAA